MSRGCYLVSTGRTKLLSSSTHYGMRNTMGSGRQLEGKLECATRRVRSHDDDDDDDDVSACVHWHLGGGEGNDITQPLPA